MKKTTTRKSVQTIERETSNPRRIVQLQKILDLMMFQSRMPTNPFMDKNYTVFESCSPNS